MSIEQLNSSLRNFFLKNFLSSKVKVLTETVEIEGKLIRVIPSHHNGLGGLVLTDDSGRHYVRNWIAIAKKKRKGGVNVNGERVLEIRDRENLQDSL